MVELTSQTSDWELPERLRAALAVENDANGLFETLADTRKDLTVAAAELDTEESDEEEDDEEEDAPNLDAIAFYVDDGEDENQANAAYKLEYLAAGKAVEALVASYRPDESQASEDNSVDFDSIESLLQRSLLRIMRGLGATVPRDVFREVLKALVALQDGRNSTSDERLSYFVSMVVAFAELADTDPAAAAHVGERFPAEFWLFYTKWFVVVYRITASFPWLGDSETSGFWLALDTVAPTTLKQTRILNALEALVEKEFAELDEAQQDAEVSEDNQEKPSTKLTRTLTVYSLQELALMLNFSSASLMPARLKDLPRLSRQANRRKLAQALCGANRVVQDLLFYTGTKTDLMRRLQVKFGLCLYYVEKIESTHNLEFTWGDSIVTAWATELSERACSGVIEQDGATLDIALIEMQETLRRMFQLPHRDADAIRSALENVDRLRGPAETPPTGRSVKNLTLEEVLEQLRKAESLDEDTLQVINTTGMALMNARSGDVAGIDECDDDTRKYRTELKYLDDTVKKVMGFYLYPVQLVSIICGSMSGVSSTSLSGESQTAALATILQMETGEGKSITFAVLAAFHARRGKKVDIATSNDQLAQDGAAGAAKLFQELGITCGVAGSANSSAQDCYTKHVAYSTISSLAGDYLREIIFQQNGRGKRAFDVILADEVDAMLVDNAANMTMLSIPVAGMDKLYFLYASVYQRIKQTMEIEGPNAEVPDHTDPDFRHQVGLLMEEYESVESSETARAPQTLPKELRSLCDKKLAVYFDQSWMGRVHMKRGREYDIVQDKIMVIENRTSGEFQAQSVYGDGLHQFLQLQHSCELTPESLNSIFISNGAFARKYTEFIGLTGTIGGALDQKALVNSLVPTDQRTQDAKRVRFVFLPRSKWRPFTLFPPLVFEDPKTANEYCMKEIQWCRAAGRPILLVCEDKATAETVATDLQSRRELQGRGSIKLYIINDPTLKTFSASDSLQPGDIVVSTTYGGRGTDYKLTAEAEKNGGLHTIVTFQAASDRLQNQIFGRSARAGMPGSGVLITYNRFLLSSPTDFESRRIEYSEFMESQYHDSLADQLKSNVPLNEGCDVLFQRFVGTYAKATAAIKSARIERGLHWYILEAVRNRFGIMMEELKYEIAAEDDSKRRTSGVSVTQQMVSVFDKWETQILADLAKGDKVITNPRAMVVYAKEIARRADHKDRGYEWKDVERVMDRAIADDKFMAGPPAHLLRLNAMMKMKKRNARLDSDYEAVKKVLDAALTATSYEVEYYGAISGLIKADAKADISTQLTRTMDVLMYVQAAIREAQTVLDEAHKKKSDRDADKYFLELSFDDLPSDMEPKHHATYKDMCRTDGYIGLPRLTEQRAWSLDWNALGCLMLGIAQVAGGAALMLMSCGAFGAGVIAEGVSDMVTAMIFVIKGDGSFTWDDYFKNKLISLAISLVCTGVCKLGKSLWSAGKAIFKSGLTVVKTAWKRMLLSAAKGSSKVWSVVKAPGKALSAGYGALKGVLKEGMIKSGHELGKELAKQVLLMGANAAVDAGMKEVFDRLQQLIADKVKENVQTWATQHEPGLRKLSELKGASAVIELSEAMMAEPESEAMELLRKFGDKLMDTICEELDDHSNSARAALVSKSIKVLVESAKWTEVIYHVSTFVDAWLGKIQKEYERELAHACCVHLEIDITPHHAVIASLGIETHTWTDVAHLQLTKPVEESELKQFEANKTLGDTLSSAKNNFKQAQEFDTKAALGTLGDWEKRALVHSKLVDLAAGYIREKLESRTAETSRKMAEFGMGKLVDKVAEGYLAKKTEKLASHQPTDEGDAAQHQKRVDKFVDDMAVDELATMLIDEVESSDMASVAHAKALAEAQGFCLVIHDENGEHVLNASASGERVHLEVSKSDDKVRRLVPRAKDGKASSEAFLSDSSGKDYLYRSVFFAINGRNATEAEVASQKTQVAAQFAASPSLKMFLYANQKPRRIYGATAKPRTA